MRPLKYMLIAAVVLFVLFAAGAVIFLKTLDVNRYRERITRQISQSIGRDVQMKHIVFDFSLAQGATLSISGLSVMDHPDFSKDPMVYVDSAHFNLDIVSLVLKQQFVISGMELDSLKLNVVRDSRGGINVQQFSRDPKKSQSGDAPLPDQGGADKPEAASSNEAESSKKGEVGFKDMLIKSIRVTDGTFIFTDYTVTPPVTVPLTRIDLQVFDMSLKRPFRFSMAASLWSDQQNIRVDNALARIDATNQQVRIDDLKMETDLSRLRLSRLYAGIPFAKEWGMRDGLKGNVVFDIAQIVIGDKGLLVLSSLLKVGGGAVTFDGLPSLPLEQVDMELELSESDVRITRMTIPLGSGTVTVSGRVLEYLSEREFTFSLESDNVRLAALTGLQDIPFRLEGRIFVDVDVNGKGMDSAALKTWTGKGSLNIQDGRVLDVNILKLVLSKISFIPDLVSRIEANLPEKYKTKLQRDETVLEKVAVDMDIRDGLLFLRRAELNADGFLITATGQMDFNQNLNLNADLYIPEDLSQSMIAASGELRALLDDQKRIHVPFKPYSGKPGNFAMYPDVADLGQAVIRTKGKEELKKVIMKALDLEESLLGSATGDGDAPASGTAGGEEESVPSSEEKMINDVLDMIPIFK